MLGPSHLAFDRHNLLQQAYCRHNVAAPPCPTLQLRQHLLWLTPQPPCLPLLVLTPCHPTDALRDEGGFERSYDGHVFLISREGAKMELRLDARMPGTVLLRDPQGYVYFMTFNTIQQVRLGDTFCTDGCRNMWQKPPRGFVLAAARSTWYMCAHGGACQGWMPSYRCRAAWGLSRIWCGCQEAVLADWRYCPAMWGGGGIQLVAAVLMLAYVLQQPWLHCLLPMGRRWT